MRILLIEDNQELAEQLATALREQRYAIDLVADGQQGWEYTQATVYDLVLMDVTLPRLDGITLCRRLRSEGYHQPILMLTAHGTSQDQVRGLDSGADDYLVKPVSVNELTARIRALLRRGGAAIAPILEWGDLKLDPSQREVRYGDRKLSVTPKEYALLEMLLRNQHQVSCRKAILEGLWSYDEDVPTENTVKAHMKGLRHKLRTVGADDLIETVYGVGYRLNSAYLHSVPAETPVFSSLALLDPPLVNPVTEKLLHVAKRHDQAFCYAQLEIDRWGEWAPTVQAALVDQLAQQLQAELSLEDVVAHLGNGKFVLGLYGLTHGEAVDRLGTMMRAFKSNVRSQRATVSAGIAAYPTHGASLERLSTVSEVALDQAKQLGGDRVLAM